ncbi:hypothetical protein E2C01_065937 [Portunus trituberculatus]|uniref:Uncharacterized protein n=1 Tax=Portunus trituberculatus TaxID=210409 RepID=A0A5B7HK69_PORTR|nr:hypothetical protein [Portunus trituberculatus]
MKLRISCLHLPVKPPFASPGALRTIVGRQQCAKSPSGTESLTIQFMTILLQKAVDAEMLLTHRS